jgi:glycosyltransferase involved in cell wall biosynthesis
LTLVVSPEVSIIVIAYNNADSLPDCLSTLLSQTYHSKRIVVVCDRSSSDTTETVVDEFVGTHESSTSIKCEGVGRSKARNLGWQAVNTPIVMFADGDDVYEPSYVSKAIQALQAGPEFGGVCLGGAALTVKINVLSKYYEAYGSTDARVSSKSQSGPDWAWVYRLECVQSVNGFDEELTQAEDKDICRRVKEAGYKIAYVKGVNWHHRKPGTIRKFVRKECLGGKRRVVYELRHKEYRTILTQALPIIYLLFALVSISVWGPIYSTIALAGGFTLYIVYILIKSAVTSGWGWNLAWFVVLAGTGQLASSAGSVYGLTLLSLQKAGILELDLGRF